MQGRRIIVIIWLIVSLLIDLTHLSETIYILSRPKLTYTWPITIAVTSCIWQELKIIRIKYRVIRRSLLVGTDNNDESDYEYKPETFKNEIENHRDENGKLTLKVVNGQGRSSSISTGSPEAVTVDNTGELSHDQLVMKNGFLATNCEKQPPGTSWDNCALSRFIATNAIHFIKLLRNLYNLLTWHFTGYLFGGDYQHLISKSLR